MPEPVIAFPVPAMPGEPVSLILVEHQELVSKRRAAEPVGAVEDIAVDTVVDIAAAAHTVVAEIVVGWLVVE